MKQADRRLIFAVLIVFSAMGAAALAQENGAAPAPNVFVQHVMPYLLATLATVVGTALTWVAAQFARWVKVRAEATQNEVLRGVLVMVAEQAGVAVQHLAQKVGDGLRAASADGKITLQDGKEILEAAIREVWENLGKAAQDRLLQEHGTFETVVENVLKPNIEAKVRESKVLTPVPLIPLTEEKAANELRLARERLSALAGR